MNDDLNKIGKKFVKLFTHTVTDNYQARKLHFFYVRTNKDQHNEMFEKTCENVKRQTLMTVKLLSELKRYLSIWFIHYYKLGNKFCLVSLDLKFTLQALDAW